MMNAPSSNPNSIQSLGVYTKKLSKVVYHLASFNEPLSREATANLPSHVIEEPAAELEGDSEAQLREQYQNVHHMQRSMNRTVGAEFSEAR